MTRRLAAVLIAALVSGACATTDALSSVDPGAGSLAQDATRTAASAAVAIVVDSVGCVLGRTDGARCAALAAMAGVPEAALRSGSHMAVEMLSERLIDAARHEQMPTSVRAHVGEWFDRSMSAAREAGVARAGAQCRAMSACSLRGGATLDQLEESLRLDGSGVRSRENLSQLFAFRDSAGELSADVEALAYVIFAHRVETAGMARPEVRDDALGAVEMLLRDLHPDRVVTSRPSATSAGAHEPDNQIATAIARATTEIRTALQNVAPRVGPASLRAMVDHTRLGAPLARHGS